MSADTGGAADHVAALIDLAQGESNQCAPPVAMEFALDVLRQLHGMSLAGHTVSTQDGFIQDMAKRRIDVLTERARRTEGK